MNKCRKCNYTFNINTKYKKIIKCPKCNSQYEKVNDKVEIEIQTSDYTAKGVVFLCTDKHKEVINSYAENGYRYVGFIPTEIDAKGCMRKIDLIFEKED